MSGVSKGVVLGCVAISAAVVGCGVFSEDDSSSSSTQTVTVTAQAPAAKPQVTTQPSATAPSSTAPPSSASPAQSGAATLPFKSRKLLKGVGGTVTVGSGKKLVRLEITAKVPDRRFSVFLYTHRGHGVPLLQGAFSGTVTQQIRIPVERLARYRKIGIIVVTRRPARRGHRAHNVARDVASVSVGQLLNHFVNADQSS